MRALLIGALVTTLAAACGGVGDGAAADGAGDAIGAALAADGRLASDVKRDRQRRPGDVLAFFGVEPGMMVLDMFSGGGYYTEILSHLVGERGVVYAHNNNAYLAFADDELQRRFAGDRLPNVRRLVAENNQLRLPPEHFDAVLLVLAYHDVYFEDEENGWPRIDGPKMLRELYRAMKPGAVLGVVDHVAEAGAAPDTGNTLHRIDPALARRDIEAAGFVFDGEIAVLRNPKDDLSKPMFDPAVRGATDRFVFRFRRPAAGGG